MGKAAEAFVVERFAPFLAGAFLARPDVRRDAFSVDAAAASAPTVKEMSPLSLVADFFLGTAMSEFVSD